MTEIWKDACQAWAYSKKSGAEPFWSMFFFPIIQQALVQRNNPNGATAISGASPLYL